MRRRRYLAAATGAASAALAGCLGVLGRATGTLATRVSDQPGDIGDFESCVVTIDAIRVKPADTGGTDDGGTTTDGEGEEGAGNAGGDGDGEDGESAGVVTIDVDGETADLVTLQGDDSQLVDESELDAGEYEWLKLDVGGVDATLDGGGEADVTTPGAAPLKFTQSFEVREGTTTSFTADFTPVKQGGSGGYVLQPVAREVEVTYEDETTETAS